MRRQCRERFSRHQLQSKPLVSDLGMHHGSCVTHVSYCLSESLTAEGGKRSRHSRRMRNPQRYVSGKRFISCISVLGTKSQCFWYICIYIYNRWQNMMIPPLKIMQKYGKVDYYEKGRQVWCLILHLNAVYTKISIPLIRVPNGHIVID